MIDEERKIRISSHYFSQTSWRTPERAHLLLDIFQEESLGKVSEYSVNDGRPRAIKSFNPERLIEQIESGRLHFLNAEGTYFAPVYVDLTVDDAEWDDMVQHRVGGNHFSACRYVGALLAHHLLHDVTPWLAMLERLAAPLDLRYGGIREYGFDSRKSDQFIGRWPSPQYLHYTERVMLFGPPEIERFGADYLRAAPVHEVRELENGAIILITSPDSLDASVPEDEALFDRVYHYLMAHPNAGKFM